MGKYVDGFVIVVAKKDMKKYLLMAQLGAKVWMEHGALEYYETVGEDLKPPMGIPFTQMAKAKAGDTVVFSWIVYKSRAHRDRVNAKVMKDTRMLEFMKEGEPLPFDMKKFAYGGFQTIVSKSQK